MTIDLHQARPIQGIPSEKDFGGCLDAQSAWKHIGGMTLSEAHHVFLDNPIYYQEDYMFMECGAFNYYFPVIDKYIREVTSEDEYDDCEVYILGCAIIAQFEWNGAKHSHVTIKEIEELTKYVLSNVHQYSQTEKDNKRINKKWNEVATKL